MSFYTVRILLLCLLLAAVVLSGCVSAHSITFAPELNVASKNGKECKP